MKPGLVTRTVMTVLFFSLTRLRDFSLSVVALLTDRRLGLNGQRLRLSEQEIATVAPAGTRISSTFTRAKRFDRLAKRAEKRVTNEGRTSDSLGYGASPPAQSWLMPSWGTSVAPGLIAAFASSQSGPAKALPMYLSPSTSRFGGGGASAASSD